MTNELLAEVSILREKVEKYEKAIEDIKAEILTLDIKPDGVHTWKSERHGCIGEVLDIIDKHISGKE